MFLFRLTRPVHIKQGQQCINTFARCAYSNYPTPVVFDKGVVTVALGVRLFSNKKNAKTSNDEIHFSDEACPQGIQGDDCVNFKFWAENCRRYGLQNCEEQLQGIQSGRMLLADVIAEQDRLIAEITTQYRAVVTDKLGDIQGVQDDLSAFPIINSPCPQGVQGDDCARFKLWLENCHRFGLHDCMRQYDNFKAGRKTLAQIFVEQDKDIREAALVVHKKRQHYSTSTQSDKGGEAASHEKSQLDSDPKNTVSDIKREAAPGEAQSIDDGQLTQRQKLKRAVKEYGSTVIVFHVTISLMSLGFFYTLVSSGIDIASLLQKIGIGGTIIQSKLAAGTGTFVMAYAVHKVFAPVRIATTLTATPFIVRYLRQIGFLKNPKVKS